MKVYATSDGRFMTPLNENPSDATTYRRLKAHLRVAAAESDRLGLLVTTRKIKDILETIAGRLEEQK